MVIYVVFIITILLVFGGYTVVSLHSINKREYLFFKHFIKEENNKFISFKELFYKADLPIITVDICGKLFNFILDSGANVNYINKKDIKELSLIKKDLFSSASYTNKGSKYVGTEGNTIETDSCDLTFNLEHEVFTEPFTIADMERGFSEVTKESDLHLHGILGNKFFQKYKWSLDFDNLVIWTKK
jgi:hypothetical protein